MKKNTLITGIYYATSIKVCVSKLAIEHMYILIDQTSNKIQKEALQSVQEFYHDILKISIIKTELYNILQVAKDIVKLIDDIPENIDIHINVSEGRKPQSLGMVYGSYARNGRISNLVYIREDNKEIMQLPRMTYQLTRTQRELVIFLKDLPTGSTQDIAKKLKSSPAITYRNIDILKKNNLIQSSPQGFSLTNFGRLALL